MHDETVFMDAATFTELAYNDHREALLTLYREATRGERERGELLRKVEALEQTVAALFEQVNAPEPA